MSGVAIKVAATVRGQRQTALEPASFALGALVPKLQVTATPKTDVRVTARTEAV